MVSKVAILCFSAMVIQTISAQCLGNLNNGLSSGYGLTNGILNNNYNNQQAIANGGCLQVTSVSPIAPTGLQVLAENLVIEGPLQVGGSLPLLGTVALEGALPTGGQAGASYGCGSGNVGIISEIGNTGVANGISGTGISSGLVGAGVPSGYSGAGIPNGLGLGAGAIGAGNLGLNGGLGCNRIL